MIDDVIKETEEVSSVMPEEADEEEVSLVMPKEADEFSSSSWSLGRVSGPSTELLIFTWFLVTEILVNFDGGGTAAVLDRLERGCPIVNGRMPSDYDPSYPCLNAADQGVLGSLPYVGLCIGAPVVAQLLQRFQEKQVLIIGLLGNAVATFLFAYVIDRDLLFLAKFTVGLCHSGIVIYAPVWVDKFAPMSVKTLWLGMTQGSVAVGVMIGYSVAGYLVACGVFFQVAFQIQAFGLVASCSVLYVIPPHMVNVSTGRNAVHTVTVPDSPDHARARSSARSVSRFVSRLSSMFGCYGWIGAQSLPCPRLPRCNSDYEAVMLEETLQRPSRQVIANTCDLQSTQSESRSIVEQVQLLMNNRIYVSTCFGLCSLFFVVTGIQYWASKYLKVSFHRSDAEVTSIFIMVAGTGPAAGVALGSTIIDRLGGYSSPAGIQRTSAVCAAWGLIAAGFGYLGGSIDPVPPDVPDSQTPFVTIVVCIWVQLLFGGAMLPPMTGVLLASVPEEFRTFGSGLANVIYNLFGYALGAYLPGQIAGVLSVDRSARAQATMKITFLWGTFAPLGVLRTYFLSRKLTRVTPRIGS